MASMRGKTSAALRVAKWAHRTVAQKAQKRATATDDQMADH